MKNCGGNVFSRSATTPTATTALIAKGWWVVIKRAKRIQAALNVAMSSGGTNGSHHKMWVIDQMVRCLTGCPTVKSINPHAHGGPLEVEGLGESDEYKRWLAERCAGSDGPNTYEWDAGIAP